MVTFLISQLAERFSLSRSTLLYYDAIGLLTPSLRSEAGYRLYSESDFLRLERVVLFRSLGVPLKEIATYLDTPENSPLSLLLKRMVDLNREIERLRDQQRTILDMIEADGSLAGIRPRLHLFESFGRSLGIERSGYLEVHRAFERASPDLHRRFLGFLGFKPEEIRRLIGGLQDGTPALGTGTSGKREAELPRGESRAGQAEARVDAERGRETI